MIQFNGSNSERGILFDERPPQVTEVTRTKDPGQPYVESSRGDPMRSKVEPTRRNPLRDNSEQAHSSHIDIGIQAEPEQSPVNEVQERTSFITQPMKEVLESPNRNEMMEELSPKHDDKEFQDMSEDFNNIGKAQRNIMITDAIQCKMCCHNATLGHTCCTCGQANPGASDEVKEKVKQVMNCFKILRTSEFSKPGNPEGKQLISAKFPNSITKPVTISRVPRKKQNQHH